MRYICTSIVATLMLAGTSFAQDAVEWRVEDGGNGHWYGITMAQGCWTDVRNEALIAGGDLVSIGSSGENEFARQVGSTGGDIRNWIGLFQDTDSPEFEEPDGGWIWATGEVLAYTNWAPTQPDNTASEEHFAELVVVDGLWNDYLGCGGTLQLGVIEWSADCNGDGIVDYGQILDGSLADDNSNGVPDSCELDHIVPDHYPSIQVAIDQTEPGMVIQVRSGTYTENIVSNSPIILRSLDGPEATIIDGNQTGTVVQLAGGQPHAIDGFTVTNGVGPANTAGGILVSGGTHLKIRNCIISNNTHIDGQYGGGGLKLNVASLQMNNCEFHGNSSSWSGGSIYIWHSCCVYITDCTFTNQGHDGTEYGPLDVVHIQNDSTATITGCVFDGNRFRDSEVVVWAGGLTTVTNCEFLNGEQTEPTQQPKAGSVFSGQAGELAIGSNYACGHPEPHVTIEFTDLGGNEFTDEPCEFTIDCNGNGIPDSEDIANFTSYDCDQNGVPDECQPDCDGDGWIDACDSDADVDDDGIPDNCEEDCNGNTIPDHFEIENGWAQDCNGNLIPDECDIVNDPSLDCDGNGALDSCEIEDDQSLDCNGNGTLDACDLVGGQGPEGAVQWTVGEGGNGHWYQLVVTDDPHISWDAAASAVPADGHLVTLTTSAENDWVFNELAVKAPWESGSGSDLLGPWIGLYQDLDSKDYSEPGGGWRWVTNEPFKWDNWNGGEPSNGGALGEEHAHYIGQGAMNNVWNDLPQDGSTYSVKAYIVEFDFPFTGSEDCNANNIPDECDIADGTSNDANGNGIPDECEDDCNTNGVPDHWDIKTGTSEDCNTNGIPDECDTADGGGSNDVNGNSIPDECEEDCNDNGSPDDWDVVTGWSEDCNDNLIPDECELAAEGAVQWTVAEGGNGHWYKIAIANGDCFDAIRLVALSQFGDLAVIESVEENQFVTDLLIQDGDYWIGLRQNLESPDYSEPGGGWEWIDGTAFVYDNWRSGEEPNNAGSIGEDSCGIENDGTWYDMESCDFGGDQYAIIEWDLGSSASALDCNTNGIPDECDIADGTCEDINSDGVPDECQCLADIDGSGAVTIDDILAVIGYWGSSSPAADVNSDGIVNITDLLFIFDQWGPCP